MKRFMTYAKNRRGVTIVLMALILFLLLALLGLAVDIAQVYFAKTQLQVAADAAALAGASQLDGTTSTLQPTVRNVAWEFACKNFASPPSASSPQGSTKNVFLVTNGPTDCTAPPASLNNGNNPDGDIVLGNWDPARSADRRFLPTSSESLPLGTTINAVKIVASRTSAPAEAGVKNGDNPVRVFIGRVFRFVGIDWSYLNARASAIGARPPQPTSGIVLCDPVCQPGFDLSQPFSLQEQSGAYSVSWTEFEVTTPIGTATCLRNANRCDQGLDDDCATANNKTVSSFIWQLNRAPIGCMQMVWANGLSGSRFDVGCAFESLTFDSDRKTIIGGVVDTWKIIVPISPVCPSGGTPGQGPYDITQFAEVEIDDVLGPTPQSIMIRSIRCAPCDDWSFMGDNPTLVK